MKEKARKSDDGSVMDVLLGVRTFLKPKRAVGRLPQLNKHAKKMRRLHNQVRETDGQHQS